ncbi:MAG: N-glycosylase/DNA lyase [Nanoarchaeota archaeon]
MNHILAEIERLKGTEIGGLVDRRVSEFKLLGNRTSGEIFKELCFCILTANFTADRGMKIQDAIGDGFLNLNENQLAVKLKELGHRFPNMRAKFIAEAQNHKDTIKQQLSSFQGEKEAREWIVKNVKGLGYKESSHFLRNIGYDDLGIIDFHIIDILADNKLITKPKSKSLTKSKYLEVEEVLKKIANISNLTLSELDLYLWYLETGKILK